jgi:integrase
MAYVRRRKLRLLTGDENPTNESLARKNLKAILKDAKAIPQRSGILVAEIIELYLKLTKDKYSERAYAERVRHLQLFAETHGWRKVNDQDCLPLHVETWLAEHPEWKSDWTKAQIVSTVLRPFNWAVKKRLIPGNPFRGIDQPEGEPRRPLTDVEFQLLLRHTFVRRKRQAPRRRCPSDFRRRLYPSPAARFRQVLIFLRFTGARPGELAVLRWEDIKLDDQVIILRRHKTSRKTRKPRVIALHPVVVKLLINIKRRGDPGEHVFLTYRLTPWNRITLGQRLRRARESAGIPPEAKLYGTRHAFGIRSILNGVDIKTLAELMGHSSTRMTEHYLSYLGGQREHLAAAMLRSNASRPAS